MGPLKPDSRIHVSHFGVIPKSHQPGKWRLIVDLSAPRGFSVNDGVPSELCSLLYVSVDEAVQRIKGYSRGARASGKVGHRECLLDYPRPPGRSSSAWDGMERKFVCRYRSAFWPPLLTQTVQCFGGWTVLDSNRQWLLRPAALSG